MTMTSDRLLRALSDLHYVGAQLLSSSDPKLVEHARNLEMYLRGSAPTIDDALDLWRGRGDPDPRFSARLAERDRLLIVLTVAHFNDTTNPAKSVHQAYDHYRRNSWRDNDRAVERSPYPVGSRDDLLFRILKLRDRNLEENSIGKIIGADPEAWTMNEMADPIYKARQKTHASRKFSTGF